MFNKEGVPFFIIIFPFLSVMFLSFFTVSYYQKVSLESVASLQQISSDSTLSLTQRDNYRLHVKEDEEKKFTSFIVVMTLSVITFMSLFTLLMNRIVKDIIQKYKTDVKEREDSLQELNHTLEAKVAKGIFEGKEKDKAILRESRLARLGSMISMIAHQWRQPLSELSGILMEMEMATKFNRLSPEKITKSLERSNERIEYMSGTIEDFRNFYKPDKVKSEFLMSDACQKALNLASAALKNASVSVTLNVKQEHPLLGYPSEFSQAILNLLSNAKDVLVERAKKHPTISIIINASHTHHLLSIKDNGGGIDEKAMDHIFDPYYSSKDASKGTGLGLYITQLIVQENMGGKLSVSNDHEGAVFTIAFERRKDNG